MTAVGDRKLKVFLSYSRKDEAFAQELLAGLEWAGFEPYLDKHDIAAGEDWEARLGRLIEAADTVVFVISPDRCAWEVERSVALKKRLLPIVFRRVDEAQVPPLLKQLNYIFFDRPLAFFPPLKTLAEALRTDIEWVREHTQIGEAALRWDGRGRNEALLFRGEELVAAKAWLASQPKYGPDPTLLHHEFIKAAEDAEAARTSAERQRLDQMAAAQADRAKALSERELAQKSETEQARRLVRRTLGSIYALLVVFFFVIKPDPDVYTALFADRLPTQHPSVAIVGIDDQTLADFKTRLPLDRQLLAKLVDAIDSAGARVIGLDLFFTHPTPPDNENLLIDAIHRCRAKVVLVAADERIDLSPEQRSRQSAFLAETGRPAGYGNVATERDWVVRFLAEPARESQFPKSFAQLLAQEAGSTADINVRRIAWLKMPADGSETFLTISAGTLLLPAGDPQVQAYREALKDKIVIIGGLLPEVDQHLTPLTWITQEPMPGALIHAHIAAQLMDGRGRDRLGIGAQLAWLSGILIAAFGFVIGWRYRLTRRGILWGRLIAVTLIAVALMFQERYAPGLSRGGVLRPGLYVLLAMLMGELSGHYLGRLRRYSP